MADKKVPFLDPEIWIRFVYMLLFALLIVAARMVVGLVVVVQFLIALFTGADNSNLRELGQGIGKWIYQAIMFMTFNSEQKPFPFDEWPEVDATEGYAIKPVEEVEEAEFVEVEEAAPNADDSSADAFESGDDKTDSSKGNT